MVSLHSVITKSSFASVAIAVMVSACSRTEIAQTGDYSIGGTSSSSTAAGGTASDRTTSTVGTSTGGVVDSDCASESLATGAQWQKTNWSAGNDFFDLYAGQNWVLARTWDSVNGDRAFLTVDDGANWNQVSTAETDIDILTVATWNGSVLAGTWNGLFQSKPGGNSWDAMTATGMPADSAVRSLAAVGTSLYAGTLGGAYRSTDGGGSWADLSSGIATDSTVTAIVGSSDTVMIGTDNKGVLVAKDGEVSWAAANSGLTDPHVSQLVIMGTRVFAVTLNGVFVSSDNGASWIPDESGLEGVNGYLVLNTQILAGTEASGVQLSSDGGATFAAMGTGMPSDARVWSLAATGGSVFAATDSGIWRLSCRGH